MSVLPNPKSKMSEEEYLAFENESEIKHEYIDGEIYAMVGASRNHSKINVLLYRNLYDHAEKRSCEIHSSDMKVKIEAIGAYTYPDMSIACGEEFAEGEFDALLNPIIIIEILSPSTEMYDRGLKFEMYRKIPSLREYILIAQDRPHIDHYKLNEQGDWVLADADGLDASIYLPSIDCTLSLADVYKRVDFTDE